jgi:hypothetical protein
MNINQRSAQLEVWLTFRVFVHFLTQIQPILVELSHWPLSARPRILMQFNERKCNVLTSAMFVVFPVLSTKHLRYSDAFQVTWRTKSHALCFSFSRSFNKTPPKMHSKLHDERNLTSFVFSFSRFFQPNEDAFQVTWRTKSHVLCF